MTVLLALTLTLTSPVPADSLTWGGFAVVEPVVVAELSRRWDVPAEALRLEWGRVNADWEPTSDAVIDLKGTGRRGYWMVGVEEGGQSLNVRLRAATSRVAMVAARPLSRGTDLAEGDFVWEPRESWGAPGPDAGSAVGWTVRRDIRKGEVLEPPLVTPPDAVRSGRPVTVEWVKGPVSITLPGTALGTVSVGKTVYVRTNTGERLQGTAVAPGRIRVSDSR